jgi:hypothetical protein
MASPFLGGLLRHVQRACPRARLGLAAALSSEYAPRGAARDPGSWLI